MPRLLIVENSEIYAAALEQSLQGLFEIKICTDGETALEDLLSVQPDALILNLSLPFKDGLTVLQEAVQLPPVVLVLSLYSNPYAEQAAVNLGAGYVLRMPSVNAVRLRLMDMLQQRQEAPDDRTKTANHLYAMQFMPHMDGFGLLCTGIPLFAQNPKQKLSIELYPQVAKLCGCSDGRAVEKTIRNAIEAAWKVRDKTVWTKYFPVAIEDNASCPSNKVFIARLAELLNT